MARSDPYDNKCREDYCRADKSIEQLVSDNGGQFTADVFQQFLRENGIKHVRSTPHYPSTNGDTDRFAQTFKNAMKAAKNDTGSIESKLAS